MLYKVIFAMLSQTTTITFPHEIEPHTKVIGQQCCQIVLLSTVQNNDTLPVVKHRSKQTIN